MKHFELGDAPPIIGLATQLRHIGRDALAVCFLPCLIAPYFLIKAWLAGSQPASIAIGGSVLALSIVALGLVVGPSNRAPHRELKRKPFKKRRNFR